MKAEDNLEIFVFFLYWYKGAEIVFGLFETDSFFLSRLAELFA